MIKTIEFGVYPRSWHNPDKTGWDAIEETSPNPNEWTEADIEHMTTQLANSVGKSPILEIHYIGLGGTVKFGKNQKGYKYPNAFNFQIKYSVAVPKTTFKKNKETIRNCLLMECI